MGTATYFGVGGPRGFAVEIVIPPAVGIGFVTELIDLFVFKAEEQAVGNGATFLIEKGTA